MNLIGLTGYARSGKDTVADILVRNHGWAKIALADPIKRICQDVFCFSESQLWGGLKDTPDRRYPRTAAAKKFVEHSEMITFESEWLEAASKNFGKDLVRHFLTPRHAAQQLGTEWARNCYEDAWVDIALDAARLLTSKYYPGSYDAQRGLISTETSRREPIRGVVISDCRFPNEVEAIHAADGIIWKTLHGAGLEGAAGQHESERHIDSLPVDAIVPRGPLEGVPTVVARMLAEWTQKEINRE
jgi:hypothetical protein